MVGRKSGTTIWTDEIGPSWAHVSVANGVLYAGTLSASELYAYNAATGELLTTLPIPAPNVGGASIVDGMVFAPYGGLGGEGGVSAWRLRR